MDLELNFYCFQFLKKINFHDSFFYVERQFLQQAAYEERLHLTNTHFQRQSALGNVSEVPPFNQSIDQFACKTQ